MRKSLASLGVLLCLIASFPTWASDRIYKYYRLSESKTADFDHSPYLLTVSSHDLSIYPHSVVNFTVSTDAVLAAQALAAAQAASAARTPASVEPADSKPDAAKPDIVKFSGRRHYSLIEENVFGRSGVSHVVFNRAEGTVYLDFIGAKEGKTFYYKEVAPPNQVVATH